MHRSINCIIVDDEHIARDILNSLLSQIDFVNVVATCRNAVEAFNVINKEKVDLIFLDINMPEISGLSFARSVNSDIKIIFTTAYREYAVEGFDLHAVDYLLKPISPDRLLQAINKLVNENPGKMETSPKESADSVEKHIFVRAERKMVKISFKDILFIESVGDYIKIHLENKSVVTRESITNIEALLPKDTFLRTHRSFIVSIDKIDSFTSEYIDIGKNQVPVSRSYRDEIMKKLER